MYSTFPHTLSHITLYTVFLCKGLYHALDNVIQQFMNFTLCELRVVLFCSYVKDLKASASVRSLLLLSTMLARGRYRVTANTSSSATMKECYR